MRYMGITGHRPDKLVGSYSRDTLDHLRYFAEDLLARFQPEWVLSGMALGWDQAMASAAILKKIPVFALLPFEGQASVWPDDAQKRYAGLMQRVSRVSVCAPPGYAAWKMHQRNERLVDELTHEDDVLVALFNGQPSGTANCVQYAESKGVVVVNVWSQWQRWIKGKI